MAYKMKGHTLPGIKQRKSPAKDIVWGGDKYHGEGKHADKPHKEESPNKWVQFIPMALSALSSMKKNKEEQWLIK